MRWLAAMANIAGLADDPRTRSMVSEVASQLSEMSADPSVTEELLAKQAFIEIIDEIKNI